MYNIEHVDLAYSVYKKLKSLILSNELVPGEKILQERLAERLGVSRTPLLKALQMLENEFLVERIPRRGMYVKKISSKEIIDAFDCREGIESIAVRLAAEKITDTQITELENLFKPFRKNPKNINIQKYKNVDQEFHKSLIKISNNKILEKIEMLGNVLIFTYQKGLVRGPNETLSEHLAIIDCLKKRDSDAAEKKIKLHIKKSRDLIIQSFKKNNL